VSRPVVELEAVSKVYGSGEATVRALDGVELVVERGEGRTIIVITHEEDVAARACRVLRMRDGRVVVGR
jgi:predicted ABC-type transport system involved in lysophospholipase L1 biosynthesis ATPase subunit